MRNDSLQRVCCAEEEEPELRGTFIAAVEHSLCSVIHVGTLAQVCADKDLFGVDKTPRVLTLHEHGVLSLPFLQHDNKHDKHDQTYLQQHTSVCACTCEVMLPHGSHCRTH